MFKNLCIAKFFVGLFAVSFVFSPTVFAAGPTKLTAKAKQAIVNAIELGKVSLVEEWLGQGFDSNARVAAYQPGGERCNNPTPLMCAVVARAANNDVPEERSKIIELLMENGANPAIPCTMGKKNSGWEFTPLAYAQQKDLDQAIIKVLEAKPRKQKKNSAGGVKKVQRPKPAPKHKVVIRGGSQHFVSSGSQLDTSPALEALLQAAEKIEKPEEEWSSDGFRIPPLPARFLHGQTQS